MKTLKKTKKQKPSIENRQVEKKQKMYFISAVCLDWSVIKIQPIVNINGTNTDMGLIPINTTPEMGVKFMPVFESYNNAKKYYPDNDVLQMVINEKN